MKNLSFAVSAVAILASLAMTPVAAGQRAAALDTSTNTFANAAGNSSRMAREHHACAVVMGLHQPGDLMTHAIRSLNKSLAELDQGRLVRSDRIACAQRGLRPGTSGFAVCVVNAEQAAMGARRSEAVSSVH